MLGPSESTEMGGRNQQRWNATGRQISVQSKEGLSHSQFAQQWKEIPWEVVSTPLLEKCKQVSDSYMGWAGPGGGVRGDALKSPFVLRGCDLGKHTQSLMLTSHSPSNTSPLSSESRVKTLSPGMSSVPPALGSKGGRVLRTPRSLPCTHWPRVQPQSLLLHGAFQSSPTAVLFPLQITTLVFVGLIPP